jgi:hypothetical protein
MRGTCWVDSVAARVAVGAKCVAIYGGMINLARFGLDSQNSIGLVYRRTLCYMRVVAVWLSAMTCMQEFDESILVLLRRCSSPRKHRTGHAVVVLFSCVANLSLAIENSHYEDIP